MNKAYLIDATKREIREVEYDHNDARAIAKLIGCDCIEAAIRYANGDCIYVDEEGLFAERSGYFTIKARGDGHPMCGNGLLVGREKEDHVNLFTGTEDPATTPEALAAGIDFMSVDEFRKWAIANMNTPAVTVTTFDRGVAETEVLSTFGDIAPISHDALGKALALAVTMFHGGGPWTDEMRAEWKQLTGSDECTTRALCDLARRVIGSEPLEINRDR